MVTLGNCNIKFLQKGIDITARGWQEKLNTALQSYLNFAGWDYGQDNDQLRIVETGSVPANITDFGDVVSP